MISYIVTETGISLYFQGEAHTIPRNSAAYHDVLDAVKHQNEEELSDALDFAQALSNKFANTTLASKVSVDGGVVRINGVEVHNAFTDMLLRLVCEGFQVDPWVKFLEKLEENPRMSSRKELPLFVQDRAIALAPDGDMILYKRVRSNYKDIHSGTFDNTPGNVVEIPARDVDDNRDVTCSYGLHVCAYDYLAHFSHSVNDKVLAVKVNPKDVVTVPNDYNNAKMRVSRYEVLDVVGLDKDTLAEKAVYDDKFGGGYDPDDEYFRDEPWEHDYNSYMYGTYDNR